LLPAERRAASRCREEAKIVIFCQGSNGNARMAEAEPALTAEAAAPATRRAESRRLFEIVASYLEALRSHHRAVLETESVEAVHKMRVTTRKLQASLDLLGRQVKVRKLKRLLRKWRRALSGVRNYDVFLELIDKEAEGRRKSHRKQFDLIKALLRERRVRKAAKIRQFLEDININKIATTLGLSLASADGEAGAPWVNDSSAPDETAAKADVEPTPIFDEQEIALYAAERIDQRLAQFQTMVAQSRPTTDPAELHQLRIAAKRVRYLLETVEQMGHGDASRALGWLRTLQDRIGDWHDLEAIEQEIVEIVSSRKFMKNHLAECSRMLQAAAHLQNKKEALVARLFPVKVPRYLPATVRRVTRAMRRTAMQQANPAS